MLQERLHEAGIQQNCTADQFDANTTRFLTVNSTSDDVTDGSSSRNTSFLGSLLSSLAGGVFT